MPIGLTLEDILRIEKAESAADELLQPVKPISAVHAGLRWNRVQRGQGFDVDLFAIGLIHRNGDPQQSALYDGGSHILSTLSRQVVPWKTEAGEVIGFMTPDYSMFHTRDCRQGGPSGIVVDGNGHNGEQFSEEILIDTLQLPEQIAEISFWVTIQNAEARGIRFRHIPGLSVEVCDANGWQFCEYNVTSEFSGYCTLQVGSAMKMPEGTWYFDTNSTAVPGTETIQQVVQAYLE